MTSTPPKQDGNDTPKWLEKLQKESWQAEILISGGALIGIISLLNQVDVVESILIYSTKTPRQYAVWPQLLAFFVLFILAEGFLLHLVLRGYWIGIIGLSYVFPKGINQDKLNFKGRFSSSIKDNSNTPHLIQLDKLCSLVFSFTFFMIFSLVGFMLFLILLLMFSSVIPTLESLELPQFVISALAIVYLLFLFTGVVTFIDFFTFGRLKRVKWFSTIYFPVHYLMSRITLSFLYRRLYYSIVSNIKPTYIMLWIGIQVLIVVLLFASDSSLSRDIKPLKSSEFLTVKNEVVKGKFLQFSITHIPRLENALFEDWKKDNQKTKVQSFNDINANERLKLIEGLYEIYIDTAQIKNLNWMIKSSDGIIFQKTSLVSLIDLSNWPNGRHRLFVRLRNKPDEDIIQETDYYAMAYFLIARE